MQQNEKYGYLRGRGSYRPGFCSGDTFQMEILFLQNWLSIFRMLVCLLDYSPTTIIQVLQKQDTKIKLQYKRETYRSVVITGKFLLQKW
jgi:hypothetical protein